MSGLHQYAELPNNPDVRKSQLLEERRQQHPNSGAFKFLREEAIFVFLSPPMRDSNLLCEKRRTSRLLEVSRSCLS